MERGLSLSPAAAAREAGTLAERLPCSQDSRPYQAVQSSRSVGIGDYHDHLYSQRHVFSSQAHQGPGKGGKTKKMKKELTRDEPLLGALKRIVTRGAKNQEKDILSSLRTLVESATNGHLNLD